MKYYEELAGEDVSNLFVDSVSANFGDIFKAAVLEANNVLEAPEPDFQGLQAIKKIAGRFDIADINLIKPGIGETTRVLLRRIPWKVLVYDLNNPSA